MLPIFELAPRQPHQRTVNNNISLMLNEIRRIEPRIRGLTSRKSQETTATTGQNYSGLALERRMGV